jgi:hypothetical protein
LEKKITSPFDEYNKGGAQVEIEALYLPERGRVPFQTGARTGRGEKGTRC